jgi:hypothetical protein
MLLHLPFLTRLNICLVVILAVESCTPNPGQEEPEYPKMKVLLASRYSTLNDFKKDVVLEYLNEDNSDEDVEFPAVRIEYKDDFSNKLVYTFESGVNQDELAQAVKGSIVEKFVILRRSPYCVRERMQINQAYLLARRKDYTFGVGDVAFYDLALIMQEHIIRDSSAFLSERDSSEKGYINTFNHTTAQALITTIYSREMARYIADVHERKNMPELLHGVFTEEQLGDKDNNPVDNYVDIINNELGQQLGEFLREKYKVDILTTWTPELLADYLNDLQTYYSWSFGIRFKKLSPEQDRIIRFSEKINTVNAKRMPIQR